MGLKETILSDSVYSTCSSLFSIIRGIIVIPLITRLLGSADYGIWTVIITTVMILKTIGGVHLHGALIRYQNSDRESEQSYIDTLSLTVFLAILLIAVYVPVLLVFDISRFIGAVEGTDITTLFIVAGLLIVFEMVYEVNKNFPRAKGDIRLYEAVSVFRTLIEILFLSAVFLTGNGLLAGLLSLVVVHVIMNAILVYSIYNRYEIPSPDVSQFPRYFRFGLPMVPKDLSGYILNQSDRYLLLFFLSPSAVGVYAVAYSVSIVLERFGTVLNPTLYPTIAKAWDENKQEEIRSVYESIFRYYTILAIPAAIGISVLARPLLQTLSTESIAEQGMVIVPFMTLAFVLRGYETVTEYILTAAEQTQKMAISTGAAAALNITMNLALIPLLGIVGAAVTTLVSQFLFALLVYRYATSHVSLPLPYTSVLKSTLSAGVMAAVLLYFPITFSSALTLLVYPVIGAVIYFAVMGSIGGISLDEVQSAARLIH